MLKRFRWWIIGGVVLALLLFAALRSEPVPVDVVQVERGPMTVSIEEDGETRVREIYTVSAPVSGRMLRLAADVGDQVIAGDTVLAVIERADPSMLDARTRAQAESTERAAQAAFALAKADVARLEAQVEFAEAEYRRARALRERGTVSQAREDRVRMELKTQRAALQTAQAGLDVRRYELETAKAALMAPQAQSGIAGSDCCFEVLAPVSGRILRVLKESEAVIPSGAALVEIGDPADLEIVADLLSTDAVRVQVGAPVLVEGWGGGNALNGMVTRVEPFGFTKISSLGVEEQRVNVVIKFTDPEPVWRRLGHGFRVEVAIAEWHSADVLQLPLGALFRHRGEWAAYRLNGSRAELVEIQIGHANRDVAELLGGMSLGDRIVQYPGPRLEDGALITARDPDL